MHVFLNLLSAQRANPQRVVSGIMQTLPPEKPHSLFKPVMPNRFPIVWSPFLPKLLVGNRANMVVQSSVCFEDEA